MERRKGKKGILSVTMASVPGRRGYQAIEDSINSLWPLSETAKCNSTVKQMRVMWAWMSCGVRVVKERRGGMMMIDDVAKEKEKEKTINWREGTEQGKYRETG